MTATAIDLFAGAGGFSTGAKQAGIKVVWAANHWADAVAIHQANHQETAHACEDLQRINWNVVPKHDILLASPACQGHSRARGTDRPRHDMLRSTAWAVVDALEIHRAEMFVVENVPEFLKWALFPAWLDALNRLGYKVTYDIHNAADFGVPQARERVFIIGHRKRHILIRNPQLPHVAAETVIDWDGPGWSRIDAKPRAERTLTQIRNGRRLHGDRFLLAYFGSEKSGRSAKKPIGTLTTNDRYAIVNGELMRMVSKNEARIFMGFPEDYILPRLHKAVMMMLGNAVCPGVAREIISQAISQC